MPRSSAGSKQPLRELAIRVKLPKPAASRSKPLRDSETGINKMSARVTLGPSSVNARVSFEGDPAALGPSIPPRIRVKLDDKRYLLGIRRFHLASVSLPGELERFRTYRQMREMGVLAPRVEFVRVAWNDAEPEVMMVVEDLSKELIETQERRDGVLFRLNSESLPSVRIEPIGHKKTGNKSRLLRRQLQTASGLLQAFLEGRAAAEEVFDVELMARFLAILELRHAPDLLRSDQLRFYFNPITQRIEPVAHVRCPCRADSAAGTVLRRGWGAQLMEDPELATAAGVDLERMARERAGMSKRELARIENSGIPNEVVRSFPLTSARRSEVKARARRLAELKGGRRPDGEPRSGEEPAGTERLVPADDVVALLRSPIPRSDLKEALEAHDFLRWDASGRRLTAKPGIHEVTGSLVLPRGLGLDLMPGTTLRFAADQILLASGPLRFLGSREEPIVLEGIAGASWSGLVSLESSSPHHWSHVEVRDAAGVDREGWILTGGVTLRAAQVRLEHVSLVGNLSEDALNLIRSSIDLDQIGIRNTPSDALDCDFCQGKITGSSFSEIGGDGIDVSGSELRIEGVRLHRVRDKAISVGEASRVSVHDASIDEVGTALASKDGSEVRFRSSEVSDVGHVAIMAFTKKPAYGPAHVDARDIRMSRVGRAALAQIGSEIILDGVEQVPEDVDIEGLYQHGYMKK